MGLTSAARVRRTLSGEEPDRVPWFLLVTLHGARELGLSIREYFSKPEHVVEGQLRMRARYRHDCLYGFFFAALEAQAFGSDVLWFDDGPPNAGRPVASSHEQILGLAPPRVADHRGLCDVLVALEGMKRAAAGEVPVIGVIMSPFSLPIMQLGFERYLDVLLEHREAFLHLMRVNEEFCVEWGNAQLAAGADVLVYFDPVASSTITPRALYVETGFEVARRTLARLKGPVATHFASGRCLGVLDDVLKTGTPAIGVGSLEDLAAVKAACAGRATVVGNLNGIEMRHWSDAEAEAAVRAAIAQGAPGGRFVLSDQHGEIPFQVPERVLMAVSDAVHRFGRYPIEQSPPSP
ncbi:MAG: uroporphyrinogen decarboxylase family protein [Deltaproteobacteria bacterium]|nr:uroporphyrinogen decarboxylase family protein [Deltaproteobacteria bacterium]